MSAQNQGNNLQFTLIKTYEYVPPTQKGSTLHVKGFGRGIDFTNAHIADISKKMTQCILDWQPARIVFDGDDFREDSFTRLILEVVQKIGAEVEIVAFLQECDTRRFCKSWAATGLQITICICELEDQNDWPALGVYALSVTGATEVMCFGGGETIKEEKKRCGVDVKFHMFAISRGEEHSVVLPMNISE